MPRNLILRYSKENDLILDQFAGSGTTLIETKLLNHNAIGVDINQNAIEICRQKFDFDSKSFVYLYNEDARKLSFIKDKSIDFICTHPPYANIIKYSDDIQGDLSHLKIDEFLIALKDVANECSRMLKKNHFCAITIGDTRKNGCMIPLGFYSMQVFLNAGFTLKETIIKEQFNCKATGFWKINSIKYNFLLIAHEYIFVFIK